MKKIVCLLLVTLYAATNTGISQTTFLSPAYSTANDDLLFDYLPLSSNRLVFVGAHYEPVTNNRHSDGVVFITDGNGNPVRQRVFQHSGDTTSLQLMRAYASGNTIDVIGLAGHDTSMFTRDPVFQSIVYFRLDTALNILHQKKFRLASGREALGYFKTLRHLGSTYGIITVQKNYSSAPPQYQPRFLKFDQAFEMVINKRPNGAMYSSSLDVGSGIGSDIAIDPVNHRLHINGHINFGTDTNSAYLGFGNVLLHRFDTNYALLDTFGVRDAGAAAGDDTVLFKEQFEVAPLDGNRVMLGPVFRTAVPSPLTTYERVCASVYNLTSKKHKIKATAPGVDASDNGTANVYTKGLQIDGYGNVYAMGTSHWPIIPYLEFAPQDNKIVVAKYDTSGNKLWHRFVGTAGGYYTASLIRPEGDSIVTVLAARYDYVASPNAPQRDCYVLRLRASDGTPTAIFPVAPSGNAPALAYPNPATDALYIRLPKPGRQATVALYAATGAEVRRATFSGEEARMPIADLAPGVYTYRVHQDGGPVGSGVFLKK